MSYSVPLDFGNYTAPAPLDEIDFDHPHDGPQSCGDYEFTTWIDRPIFAFNHEGQRVPATLATQYSGIYTDSPAGMCPIEHVTPHERWGLRLVDSDGKPVALSDAELNALEIPCGPMPPWEINEVCTIDSTGEFVPVRLDSPLLTGAGKCVLFRHPATECLLPWPVPWPGRDPDAGPVPTKSKTRFISAAEFLAEATTVRWFTKGLIPQDTTGAVFGPSGEGKTFVLVCIAIAGATGRITLGGREVTKGIVMYCAGEGFSGLKRRVKAYVKHHGIDAGDLALLHLSKEAISFETPDIRDAITEGRALQEKHGQPVTLIVIDTLNRHLVGDENSTADMSAFIKAVDALRGAFPGSVAIVVHHTGHAETARTRARGSSALKAAMDFEILCRDGELTFTKVKDAEAPPPIEFKLVPVEIGTDEDGEPITSCIVEYGQKSAKNGQNGQKKLGKAERLGLETLQKICQETSQPFVDLGSWRFEFYRSHWADGADAKRKAFTRARECLVSGGLVRVEDDNYSIITPDKIENVRDSPDGVRGVERTDKDPPLRGGPVVRTLSASEVQVFDDDDFGEAGQ